MNSKPSRDRLTNVLIVIVILMGVEIIYLIAQNYKLKSIIKDPKKYFETLSEDEIVPSFTAQDIDGNDLSLRYSPAEPYTILFWFAPTCSSCEDNIAFWKRIYRDYNSQKLRFLGMFAGNRGEARNFVSKHAIEFPVVCANHRNIVDLYKGNVLPQTVLIAPTGAIRGVWPGVLSERKEDEIIVALKAINP